MALPALLTVLAPIVTQVVGNLFPDPQQKAEAQQKAMESLLAHSSAIEEAAGRIIQTEAASAHWLAANWRPIVMLTFCGLIVARWMGWTAPNLSEAEYLKLWDIVELGLGGYVIGRSAEKVLPKITEAFKR